MIPKILRIKKKTQMDVDKNEKADFNFIYFAVIVHICSFRTGI